MPRSCMIECVTKKQKDVVPRSMFSFCIFGLYVFQEISLGGRKGLHVAKPLEGNTSRLSVSALPLSHNGS